MQCSSSTQCLKLFTFLKLVLGCFCFTSWQLAPRLLQQVRQTQTRRVFHRNTPTPTHTHTQMENHCRIGKCTKLPLVNQQSRRRSPENPYDFPALCMLCISLSGSWNRYVSTAICLRENLKKGGKSTRPYRGFSRRMQHAKVFYIIRNMKQKQKHIPGRSL